MKHPSVASFQRGGTLDGLSRSTRPRSQEEAEGQVRNPKVQPLSEPPMNVELIRKPRKARWDEEDKDET